MSILENNDIIYVSLGTFAPNAVGLSTYDNIVEAFRGTKHKILISAGFGKAEDLIAKGLPENIIVKSWVPQIKVLEHSKLFISHVGAGGFVEGLSKGVPFIAVPNFSDQFANATVVEKLNLGRWLKDKSPENIRRVVEEVLVDESIPDNCRKYKDLIDTNASKERFVDIVKSMIAK